MRNFILALTLLLSTISMIKMNAQEPKTLEEKLLDNMRQRFGGKK